MRLKVAVHALDADPRAADDLVVRAQEKMDVVSRDGEFGSIEATQGATAHDGDLHATGSLCLSSKKAL
jgi:hypothetical protein